MQRASERKEQKFVFYLKHKQARVVTWLHIAMTLRVLRNAPLAVTHYCKQKGFG
jgi:hypothetical protein